jgi:hypothetical protein
VVKRLGGVGHFSGMVCTVILLYNADACSELALGVFILFWHEYMVALNGVSLQQGLLRLLYGIFCGDASLMFCSEFDMRSMKYDCAHGNGPTTAICGSTKMGAGMVRHRGTT